MEKLANDMADAETGIVYSEEIKAANKAEAEKFEGANVVTDIHSGWTRWDLLTHRERVGGYHSYSPCESSGQTL